MDKKLTVVITTYNREEKLLAQLDSLYVQGQFDKYKIVISDNCSNYDVQSAISNKFPQEFVDIIRIYRRPYNVGGDVNIAFSFQLVDTEWMWLLSDDDLTCEDSIESILNSTTEHKDVCWIKHSINGFNPLDNAKISNLSDLFLSFCKEKPNYGQFIFMSNNVYNIYLLKEYIGKAPLYASTCMSHLVPPIYCIKEGKGLAYLSNKSVVRYTPDNRSYNLHYMYLNFSNFVRMPLNLTNKEFLAFKKLFNISYRYLYHSLTEIEFFEQKQEAYRLYKVFYSGCFTKFMLSILWRLPFIYKIYIKLKYRNNNI